MQWLLDNWILVLFGGGMIAMHLFGHGHGGHGGKKGDDAGDEPKARDSPEAGV
jgi:hypothetical protein